MAASLSSARSASTWPISACSSSRLPNALRWRAWWIAWFSPARIIPATPTTMSKRVWCAISIRVGMPRPGSPTSQAQVSRYSISDDAFERFPHLSLRRWMRNGLRVASGRERGTKKQVTPSARRASVKKASLMGAEQNHLWPIRRKPSASRWATLCTARRSDPPCFSVIAMPMVAAAFWPTGAGRGS